MSFSKARLTAVALASGAAALLGSSSTNTYIHTHTHKHSHTLTRARTCRAAGGGGGRGRFWPKETSCVTLGSAKPLYFHLENKLQTSFSDFKAKWYDVVKEF